MKRIVFCALLMMCIFVPSVKGVSQQDLQDTTRFTRLYSQGDTGGGDGKYIEPASITYTNLSKDVRRIEATIYVLAPAHNQITEYHVQYDYDLTHSFAYLQQQLQLMRDTGKEAAYFDLWNYKLIDAGIKGTLLSTHTYQLDGTLEQTHPPMPGYENVSYITPTDFDFESYKIANRVYHMVYGTYYDDMRKQ